MERLTGIVLCSISPSPHDSNCSDRRREGNVNHFGAVGLPNPSERFTIFQGRLHGPLCEWFLWRISQLILMAADHRMTLRWLRWPGSLLLLISGENLRGTGAMPVHPSAYLRST
jgi:hypothetical protein